MSDERDARLRAHFARLREHDQANVPALAAVLARRRDERTGDRRHYRPLAFGAAALAIIAALVLVRIAPRPDAALESDTFALPPWPAQTDSLLAIAGTLAMPPAWTAFPTSRLGAPSLDRSREKS